MDNPRPTNGVPDRDVLVEMVKLQLDAESKNQDVRRDTFLCLAISLPSQQRTRVKEALRPFLARAQITGSGRDPGEDHGLDAGPLASLLGNLTLDDHVIAIELEKRIGIVSTLLVLGCKSCSLLLNLCLLLPKLPAASRPSYLFSTCF